MRRDRLWIRRAFMSACRAGSYTGVEACSKKAYPRVVLWKDVPRSTRRYGWTEAAVIAHGVPEDRRIEAGGRQPDADTTNTPSRLINRARLAGSKLAAPWHAFADFPVDSTARGFRGPSSLIVHSKAATLLFLVPPRGSVHPLEPGRASHCQSRGLSQVATMRCRQSAGLPKAVSGTECVSVYTHRDLVRQSVLDCDRTII